MSRTWKWILGILAALLIIGVVASAIFVCWNHAPLRLQRANVLPPAGGTAVPNEPNPKNRPAEPFGWEGRRSFGRDDMGWGMPMMYGHGWARPGVYTPFGLGFMIIGGILRLIVPLGILALVAYLFYQMGKRAGAAAGAVSTMPDTRSLPARKVARR
jgi:hypothetical protein